MFQVSGELAACKTLAVRSIPVFTMRSLEGLFRAVYDMLLDRFCPGCPTASAAVEEQLGARDLIAAFLGLHFVAAEL